MNKRDVRKERREGKKREKDVRGLGDFLGRERRERRRSRRRKRGRRRIER